MVQPQSNLAAHGGLVADGASRPCEVAVVLAGRKLRCVDTHARAHVHFVHVLCPSAPVVATL